MTAFACGRRRDVRLRARCRSLRHTHNDRTTQESRHSRAWYVADIASRRVIGMRKAAVGKCLHAGCRHLPHRHTVGVTHLTTIGANLQVRQRTSEGDGLDVRKSDERCSIDIDTMASVTTRAYTVVVKQRTRKLVSILDRSALDAGVGAHMALLAASAEHGHVINTRNFDRIDDRFSIDHRIQLSGGRVMALHAIGGWRWRFGVDRRQAGRWHGEVGMAVAAGRRTCNRNMPIRQRQRAKAGKAAVTIRTIKTCTGVGGVTDCKRSTSARARLEAGVVGMRHVCRRRQARVKAHADPLLPVTVTT